MRTRLHPQLRRFLTVAVVGTLAMALTACTARGGGQLPPGLLFNGAANFGFSFSCEDSGGMNPRPGQLRIQLSYADKGSDPIGSSFSIHGVADTFDPVLESMLCAGQNPPTPPNQLIFLGRYRFTSSAPAGPLSTCETTTPGLCRFEVMVRDNDRNAVPSTGDYFQIKLSRVTALTSEFLDPVTVPYTRGGRLSSGNITVD